MALNSSALAIAIATNLVAPTYVDCAAYQQEKMYRPPLPGSELTVFNFSQNLDVSSSESNLSVDARFTSAEEDNFPVLLARLRPYQPPVPKGPTPKSGGYERQVPNPCSHPAKMTFVTT